MWVGVGCSINHKQDILPCWFILSTQSTNSKILCIVQIKDKDYNLYLLRQVIIFLQV